MLNSALLNAANYNEDILNIYSKMAPRFVVMSSQKDKMDDVMDICALYDELDERVAKSLRDKIQSAYPNGLQNHPIKLTLSDYSNFESCKNAQLVFMFNADDERVKKAFLFFQNNRVMTMAYDISFLEKGADVSLFIGRTVTPYLNMKSISEKKILLDNLLLRVSKIYVEAKK
jgi:hypothetical protein